MIFFSKHYYFHSSPISSCELTEKQEEKNGNEDVEVDVGIALHPSQDFGSKYSLPSKTNPRSDELTLQTKSEDPSYHNKLMENITAQCDQNRSTTCYLLLLFIAGPVNRSGSPQGFSQVQFRTQVEYNTNMHIT